MPVSHGYHEPSGILVAKTHRINVWIYYDAYTSALSFGIEIALKPVIDQTITIATRHLDKELI